MKNMLVEINKWSHSHGYLSSNFLFSALVYILLFIFCLYPYRDYDWGWHYRLGEYFIKNGKILFMDPFSSSIDGFRWVNHEWLYDPFHYLFFNTFSFIGMSVAGALLSVSWFYLGVKRYKISFIEKAILALFFSNMISGVVWQGLRIQMIGTLFIAVIIYLIPNIQRADRKTLFLLPVLFLLCANIHGYFILGLCIFGIVVFSQILIELKKGNKDHAGRLFISKNLLYAVLCIVVCFLVTLINPFTYEIYLEGLRHLHNPLLKYILEWIPFDIFSTFSLIFFTYTFFIIGMFIKRRRISDLPYLLIFLFMLYYALTARRYVSVYAVATLPIVAMFLESFHLKLDRYKTSTFLFLICCVIGLEIGIFRRIPGNHLLTYTFTDYCNFGSGCSEEMVAYLKKHPPKGKGFNFYDWGGYLIGRGIPAKLFIDGRMHLWTDPKTGFKPFEAYQSMYYDGNYDLFNKYNFDWLIIGKTSLLFEKLSTTKELGIWEAVFESDNGVYLVRIKTK